MINDKQTIFSKQHTAITKGILIIMMLIHHVFFPNAISEHGIKTILSDQALVTDMVLFCKICIAGFAFLTAFGITRSFKSSEDSSPKAFFSLTVRRFLKLEFSVGIIYLFAILYKHFIMQESLHSFYNTANDGLVPILLYMVIDLLGMASYAQTPILNVTWWYLSYAILLIAAMPFIYKAYEKFRYLLLPAACLLLPCTVTLPDVSFFKLLPIATLGTAFAYEDWFEKLGSITKPGKLQAALPCYIWLLFCAITWTAATAICLPLSFPTSHMNLSRIFRCFGLVWDLSAVMPPTSF